MVYNATLPFYLSPNLTNLPQCPSASDYPGLIEYISFPSIVFISCALGAISLIFGLATSIFYNSVPVYEKKEHLGVVSTNERLGMLLQRIELGSHLQRAKAKSLTLSGSCTFSQWHSAVSWIRCDLAFGRTQSDRSHLKVCRLIGRFVLTL